MDEFYLVSIAFVIAACLPLWRDASRRKEYGPRPALLFASLALILLVGAVAALRLIFGGGSGLGYPMYLTIQALYIPAFFLLEYSVHIQRIKKNLLGKDFGRKTGYLALIYAGELLACAAAWIAYFATGGEGATGRLLTAIGAASTILLIAAYLVANAAFDLQTGIIRRVRYPFLFGAVISFPLAFLSGTPFAAMLLLSAVNLVFGARVFHEYFFYRMGHVNDMHDQQIGFEHSRGELINKVLFASSSDDVKLICDDMRASLDNLKRCFVKTDLVFGSMMAFRRSGDLLVVDDAGFILDYCVPIADIEHIKQMKAEVLHSQIMAQAFDLAKIRSGDGLDFAESAVRKMIETKALTAVESLPQSLARVFKLIVLKPIFNQEELLGMLVLFKTGFDYVFPQEGVIIDSLARNLSLIFAIIEGKKIQGEKNRLGREMDIAKNIQTSILPRAFDMEGYETDAQMITATEVGGDLYDFVKTKQGNYLDIADVAGHGLPAGITALIHMAAFHASLRTSEALGRELEVPALYDIVNAVLVEINRDRIGSDKFMTCNMIAHKGDSMDYAGSHLIGLVYRTRSGEIEEIEGMQGRAAFLGISEYAESAGSRGRIDMQGGDLLLLYTDGLIEARDMNDRFFGFAAIKETLKSMAGSPLGDIKAGILERLKAFTETGDRKKYDGNYADDVSLVLIRKK
jgi:phosphoserine phosphatase RsbU/P